MYFIVKTEKNVSLMPSADISFEKISDIAISLGLKEKCDFLNGLPLYDNHLFTNEELTNIWYLVNSILQAISYKNHRVSLLDITELINLHNLCSVALRNKLSLLSIGD